MPSVNIAGSVTRMVRGNVYQDTHYSREGSFEVGQDDLSQTLGFIKFTDRSETDKLPVGATVSSAYLNLFCETRHTNRNRFVLAPVSDAWNENGITWNTRPTTPYDYDASYFLVNTNSWNSFSVINTAQNAINDVSYLRTGFRVRHESEAPTYATFSGGTSSRRPYIRVNYYAAPLDNIQANYVDSLSHLVVSGSGVDNAKSVEVQYSSSSNGSYVNLGQADLLNSVNRYSIVDSSKAPKPSNVRNLSATADGNNITLSFSASSQTSLDRYYRARRRLSDGTSSNYTSPEFGQISPSIVSYEIERGSHPEGWITVRSSGTSLTFTDNNLEGNKEYRYRVRPKNSQGTLGDWEEVSIALNPDPAPSFDSLSVEDDYYFVASVSGVPSGATPRLYHSGNDNRYYWVNFAEVTAIGENYELRYTPPVEKPSKPVFDAAGEYEDRITLSWSVPHINSTLRYIRLSYVQNGLESEPTNSKREVLTPRIAQYEVQRKPQGANNSQYITVYTGSDPAFNDTNISVGGKYTYRVVATTNHGDSATSDPIDGSTGVPVPASIDSISETNGTVRVAGSGRNGADSIYLYQKNTSYIRLGEASFSGLLEGEDWAYQHTPEIYPPNKPNWGDTRVDTSGVYLNIRPPVNPQTDLEYAASRYIGGVEGSKSDTKTYTVSPTASSYRIRRRKTPRAGEESNPEFAWSVIANTSETTFTDTDVDFSSSYDYQVLAYNNYDLYSTYSVSRTLATQNPPQPPPDPSEGATPPVAYSPSPEGVLSLSDETLRVRIGWSYQDHMSYTQRSYRLKAEVGTNAYYWNGSSWISSQTDVETAQKRADVDPSIFSDDTTFTLSVLSNTGLRSGDLVWDIYPAFISETSFDLNREVKRNVTSSFDLLRDIRSYADKESYSVKISWNVKEPLPFEVDDGYWEGGGNTWVHTVFDRDGRPEPYAEVDFEREGERYTFTSDYRGRFQLKVPDDIPAGIYSLRERGPSMAPRNTENIVIKDDWLIYSHGHRHTADGPDPIYGITSDQISDEAEIHPSQISGGESLGEIVDEYGSQIKQGLERHVSSGHGNFVASGFGYTLNGNDMVIDSGICWQDSQKLEPYSTAQNLTDGSYKIYVDQTGIRIVLRAFYPTNTCPLYSVEVSGSDITVTDDRLYHPPFETINARTTPVKWGPEDSYEILHGNDSLGGYLSQRISQLDERLAKEEELRGYFDDENRRIQRVINEETQRRNTARETGLQVSYASSTRYLYSMFRTEEKGSLPPTASISDFSSTQNLSSLTSLRISDGVATLPENWTTGAKYTLRTLKVASPPSYKLQFALVYEETGADFEVWGSLANEGFYLPKRMSLYRSIPDTVRIERLISETPLEGNRYSREVQSETHNLRLDTYRIDFPEAGTEAVIECLIRGGSTDDGCRLHGWFVNAI